ncbi:hypothetical protein OG948_54635 (plasmid) [Embleya sp. NBC_00888]|uniref:hypothetical protein n=1 Tax=Embleya sp. NBC_00888 TaxID=2975960 RepID=UPI002F90DC29|nr:hypothetical protein OG948_54635 [Embleya sp. NBC_00888]
MVNYGARRQGRAHGEFWMRFARSKQGEEAEETLSETSALLFDSMKGAQEQARDEDPDNAAEDTNNREVTIRAATGAAPEQPIALGEIEFFRRT